MLSTMYTSSYMYFLKIIDWLVVNLAYMKAWGEGMWCKRSKKNWEGAGEMKERKSLPPITDVFTISVKNLSLLLIDRLLII